MVSFEDLAGVDEFHVGGRLATEHLLTQLNFTQSSDLLDVGCGLGGAARYVASIPKAIGVAVRRQRNSAP
jgi:cyclopropane fatty-acyl-phospholipid synthase-like methyltransferase